MSTESVGLRLELLDLILEAGAAAHADLSDHSQCVVLSSRLRGKLCDQLAQRSEAWKLHEAARNDGERRTALFAAAVIYADEGKLDQALAELNKEYAVAERINDAAAMSADLVAMGDVALEAGKPDEARKFYARSLMQQERSDLSDEVKEDGRLNHHYNWGGLRSRPAIWPVPGSTRVRS